MILWSGIRSPGKTATKVKFFHNGDTLVYNADAFQLAEGSMLDALIRQLPGAELKDDGRILVNGRFVEALLLNGEDFFRGDNRLMLDNLPAYMVRHLKVYEKESDAARATGMDFGSKQLVMDVRLKRDYEETWLANVEAGGGSEQRWLGSAFALRMTKNSRLAAYAKANNLNDTRRPGENTEWTPEKMPQGQKTVRSAGAEYLVKDRDGKWKVTGDVLAEHTDESVETRVSGMEFLPGQSVWRRSESQCNNHDVKVQTVHNMELFLARSKYILFLQPAGSYRSWRHDSHSSSATFNDDPSLYVPDAAALLDSIRQPHAGRLLQRLAANRTLYQTHESGRAYHAGFAGAGYVTMNADRTKFLQYKGSVNYNGQQLSNYSHYLYDYPLSGASSDYRNRYAHTEPNHQLTYEAVVDYQAMFTQQIYYGADYSFTQTLRSYDYSLYRLDRLAGYGAADDAPLGMLPSEVDYFQTIDLQNSSRERSTDTRHQLNLRGKWSRKFGPDQKYDINVNAELPFILALNTLDYRRANFDGRTHRTRLLVEPDLISQLTWNQGRDCLSFEYQGHPTLPEMTRLLDIRSDADPLNITTGNPDLHTIFNHVLILQGRSNRPVRQRTLDYTLRATFAQNAIAMGYTYDRQTGIHHYRPENVNGNRLFSASVNYSIPLDRKHHLTLRTSTYAQRQHGVDLIGGERSTVRTDWITERLTLDWQLGRVRLGAKGYVGYNQSHSHRDGFQTQHVWDFNYGPTLNAELPWHLQLKTDLTMYSRRGFASPSANTNDLVWNARLSRHFTKPGLTLAIDGFDILHQLSNYTYMMNSQGRTETFHNSLPSYVVAHLIWHLSKKPKRKPVEVEYVK